MTENSSTNKRIAKNTIYLYVRLAVLMAVSLLTSRIILEKLGVEDYGIYNVVGGLVTMFSLISNTLTAAISRFITYELGTGNLKKLNQIFCTSVNIQLLISILVIIIAEIVGTWFLNNKLTIASDRLFASQVVFQFSLVTFCVNLISVPYNATLIAHEHINTYAVISIVDSFLKLIICYCISIGNFDKLIIYAFLMAIESVIIRIIYGIYCKSKFRECKYCLILDFHLLKKMLVFSGWNFIGASSSILRDQGVNVLINLFWGATVNAARGISMSLCAAVSSFSNNIVTAINPQITKRYAIGDHGYVFELVTQGARLSYYLILFVSLPILLETTAILNLWLTTVPDYAISFVRLVVLYIMAENISNTMITLQLATGKIRNYQIVVGGVQLLNFPLSYIFLYQGFEPQCTYIIAIVLSIVCLFLRLLMLKRMISFPVSYFLHKVVFNIIGVTIVSFLPPYLLYIYMPDSLYRLALVCLLSVMSTLISIMSIGCNNKERVFLVSKIKNIINRSL